ncbi:hypothetical protein [Halegenticoccus tardaugens]|nr:hypothetical protein [Halegenticoccus tardaugens]
MTPATCGLKYACAVDSVTRSNEIPVLVADDVEDGRDEIVACLRL